MESAPTDRDCGGGGVPDAPRADASIGPYNTELR